MKEGYGEVGEGRRGGGVCVQWMTFTSVVNCTEMIRIKLREVGH